jgi:hypothetical protein
VEDLGFFSNAEKTLLKERMRSAGLDPEQENALPFTGRGHPLLAVFDPASLKIVAILKSKLPDKPKPSHRPGANAKRRARPPSS